MARLLFGGVEAPGRVELPTNGLGILYIDVPLCDISDIGHSEVMRGDMRSRHSRVFGHQFGHLCKQRLVDAICGIMEYSCIWERTSGQR
jgi:hypothetical protein